MKSVNHRSTTNWLPPLRTRTGVFGRRATFGFHKFDGFLFFVPGLVDDQTTGAAAVDVQILSLPGVFAFPPTFVALQAAGFAQHEADVGQHQRNQVPKHRHQPVIRVLGGGTKVAAFVQCLFPTFNPWATNRSPHDRGTECFAQRLRRTEHAGVEAFVLVGQGLPHEQRGDERLNRTGRGQRNP